MFPMNKVYRYHLIGSIYCDTGALPCPRCRSVNTERESHPATGSMATCRDCGARSYLEDWNNGQIWLDKIKGRKTFGPVDLLFRRPDEDVIEKTTRTKAHKIMEKKRAAV